jgi:hypothetical protein
MSHGKGTGPGSATPCETVVARLQNVKRSGSGFTARCPAHEDQNNSLSVSEGEDGRALLNCFVGCQVSTIAANIGLSLADLFPRQGGRDRIVTSHQCNTATVTVIEYSAAKKLPVDFLRSLGLSDICYQGQSAIRIPYFDNGGAEIAVRIRTGLEKSAECDNRFRWRKGSKPRLYGLWRELATDYAILCEGESDCHTLWFHGFPALGVPGSTNWNEERDAPHFDGVAIIYVVIEPDKGGEAVQTWLAKSKIAGRAKLLTLDGLKDPSALHLDDPVRFLARLREAMEHAIPVSRAVAEQDESEKAAAWEQCKDLAGSVNSLERFEQTLRARGVVGEERGAKLLYLALTTRLLERPVSVAIKGPSSGGKSFLTEQVLSFFPASAVYCLSAMSERALAYTDADLKNRFLVIFEAAGISGDFASYLVRSLLSEGKLIYEVVEKTQNGLKPRRIEKTGPTGLLVTTTATRLHPENETRLLSLHVADTREQTQAVLLAIAEGVSERVDLGPWIALQEWLQRAEHRVIVPFARQLAEKVQPISVRLRRDFTAVLALVKAHAILHQVTRERDAGGHIVATPEDYSAVRSIVGDIVAEGIEATVSGALRETVEAVSLLVGDGTTEVPLGRLAKALNLDKSVVSRRVTDAIQRGYLKNLEEKRGRPARLMLAEALPDKVDVLPPVKVLQCCGVHPELNTPSPTSGNASDAKERSFVEAEI